jgi:hypothetical protein
MKNFLRNLTVIVVSFVLAAVITIIVHEGGHTVVAELSGADTTDVQLFWLNISRSEDTNGEFGPWEMGLPQWEIGEDPFGSMHYQYLEKDITLSESGWIDLMGSSSTFILATILLAALYRREQPTRFPWLAVFIILIGIVDMFTYSVVPMLGEYVTLVNQEADFVVVCSDWEFPEYIQDRPADFPKPDFPFEPQVRTVKMGCGYQNDRQYLLAHLAVEFDQFPEPERLTRLFVLIQTPEGTRWLESKDFGRFEIEGYAAYDFFYSLPPVSGEYKVDQAFLVNDGLRRLLFFYGNPWTDGLILVEPLYGAVQLNINPFLFLGMVSVLSAVMSFFFLRYVVIIRRKGVKLI